MISSLKPNRASEGQHFIYKLKLIPWVANNIKSQVYRKERLINIGEGQSIGFFESDQVARTRQQPMKTLKQREVADAIGRPNTSATDENMEAVKKIILNNRRITIRAVADAIGAYHLA